MINENLSPEAIKNMSLKEMELLSYEIRDFLIENVSKTGGHLASNLGIVELTIALHRVFDTPSDKIVWDVGHQAYVHKIITGRADKFITLRQTDGLSGFPKRKESEHDTFDSGHSSNSVSAALGMAIARDLAGEKNEVIAVIGDGALTGGMAFEALNNAGDSESKLIVVLNDNEMSISSNTGGITKHLSKLRTSKGYLDFKKRLKNTLKNIPSVGDSLYRGVESLRDTLKFALVDEGAIFESLGFTYLGPIDGHNIEETVEALNLAKRAEGPVLLHVTTKKGKGYKNAEMHPDLFHGIGVFDQTTGVPEKKSSKTYS
ncbi:MAG: 1-deoxy-D-xylulose-5-phosphate synthase, partial [Firmicutes bacterium]|nr:1-deoxy-D-xylulose-5-phosphate synthase [Bacillota bacterium]